MADTETETAAQASVDRPHGFAWKAPHEVLPLTH